MPNYDGRYWYNPELNTAWPYDGCHDGDDQLIELIDAEKFMSIFDTLPRLCDKGYTIVPDENGTWRLMDSDGVSIVTSGRTFRELCVNIVLAGL